MTTQTITGLISAFTGSNIPRTPTNPELLALHTELLAFADKQLDEPTADDRNKLMTVRGKIKNFDRTTLGEGDLKDLNFLYVESTSRANRQEDYYEGNGGKFSDGRKF